MITVGRLWFGTDFLVVTVAVCCIFLVFTIFAVGALIFIYRSDSYGARLA